MMLLLAHLLLATCSREADDLHEWGNIHWGDNSSLMLSLVHHCESDNTPYAYTLLVEAFGGYISFCFGHKYNDIDTDVNMYGFNSVNGEILCSEFLWMKKSYQMPWDTKEIYLQETYLNPSGEFVSKDEAKPFKKMTDTCYYTKSGEQQQIQEIDFYILERVWTSKLSRLLHLTSIINTKKVSILWDAHSEVLGNSDANCGLIKSVPTLTEYYNTFKSNPSHSNIMELNRAVDVRLGYFMMIDKNY